MISAWFSLPDFPRRHVYLANGVSTVGSDLTCSIVLLDPMVAGHHFTFHVNDGLVAVEVAPGKTLILGRADSSKSSVLKEGERHSLCIGHRLWIDEMVIDVTGLSVRTGQSWRSIFEQHVKRKWWPTFVCCSGLAMCGVWLLPPIAVSSSGMHGPVKPDNWSIVHKADASYNLGALTSHGEVLNELNNAGLSPYELHWRKGKWRAIFYVSQRSERAEIIDKLRNFHVAVHALVYIDDELQRAAERALSGMGYLWNARVAAGILTLSDVYYQDRESLRQNLMADIPGLRDVKFEKIVEGALTTDELGLVAMWNGDRPYVVTKDNRIVRVGEKISMGVKLAKVCSEYVMVDVRGDFRKVNTL